MVVCVYQNILCPSLFQDFVSSESAFQYMMKFPLLKMLHYRVIVGKLLSTIQMTEVSKLFLQKNISMVRSSFRSGYTSKSSDTFVAFTVNSVLTVISTVP